MDKSPKPASHFSTDHLSSDLKQRSVRGAAVTMFGQGIKFFLQLASMMVLARLLTPEDFGLIAMVAAATGFILLFKDMGLSMATVQRAKINHEQISTLFWINVVFSVVLMLITVASAPLIVWFFNEPRLFEVTLVLSTAFLLGGLTVQHQALLRRQMKLTEIAIIDVSAMAAGVLVAILCAFSGWGYWALVWMQIATAAVNAVGVWIASSWRPGWAVRGSGVRDMLKFGGYMTAFSIVNFFSRNLDNILLGRYWGQHSTGIYTRAYSLLLLPIGQVTSPVTAVAVPALSRLQDDPVRYGNYYLKAIRVIAYATMPLVVAMAVLSTEIIDLVLGDQWQEAASIFTILAVPALIQPVGSTVGWLYVSLGQTRRMFIWSCISSPVTIAGFILGLNWGAMGVATGYAITNCILIFPQMAYACWNTPVKIKTVIQTIYRPLILSIMAGLFVYVFKGYLVGLGSVYTIIISTLIGGAIFGVSFIFLRPFRADVDELLATARLMTAKRS